MGAANPFRSGTPPHNLEAEHGVLGALLMQNDVFDHVADLLQPEHFYRGEHRAIYSTITRLIVANKVADVITVFEAGGHDPVYLNQLVTSVPGATAARRYAEIVLDRWTERRLMKISSDLLDLARQGFASREAMGGSIEGAVSSLLALSAHHSSQEPQSMGDLIGPFVDHLTDLAEGKDSATATGFADLDRLTAGGIRAGELWVIGARPSMGKTSFTGTLARNVAGQAAALFCSMEDSRMALIARQVAALGRINLADLRNPAKAPDSMWPSLTEGVDLATPLELYIDDESSLTAADVRRKIQQVQRKTKRLRAVVVDYLQLMVGRGENRNVELGRITNDMKATAKDLGVGVVLLSQMNREADKRPGAPQMSDLRDSGDIEGAADLIGLLHRDHRRNPTEANKHHAELHVVKHKNGACDTINLYFDGAFQRFADWDGPPPMREASRGRSSAKRGGDIQ